MLLDSESQLFDPFRVGTSAHNQRFEYEPKRSPTYPPPVFVPLPQDPADVSKSQDAFAKLSLADMKDVKSHKGEVVYSKAIKEEMAAAKKQAVAQDRIYAGGHDRDRRIQTNHKDSLTVIMPAKKQRSASQSSISISVSSKRSLRSQASTTRTHASKLSNNLSTVTRSSKRTDSNITLGPKIGVSKLNKRESKSDATSHSERPGAGAGQYASSRTSHDQDQISLRSKTNVANADNVSRVSVRSKTSELQADNISRVSVGSRISHASVKSRANLSQADNKSRVSVRSKTDTHKADNMSHVSKQSGQNADNISQRSIKSKLSEHQADNISRVSVKSKASERQADTVSLASVKSKADNVSVKSQTAEQDDAQKEEVNKPPEISLDFTSSYRAVGAYIKKELESANSNYKTLAKKAYELKERLRAGNENKHNRFDALVRMYTNTEPLKRCREDRMSIWFKDSLLS